jgi:hypothetical protein
MATPSILCSVCKNIFSTPPVLEKYHTYKPHHVLFQSFYEAVQQGCLFASPSGSTWLKHPKLCDSTKMGPGRHRCIVYIRRKMKWSFWASTSLSLILSVEPWDKSNSGLSLLKVRHMSSFNRWLEIIQASHYWSIYQKKQSFTSRAAPGAPWD